MVRITLIYNLRAIIYYIQYDIIYMSLLFLVLDKSRENDRDAICAVMRQLLRKSFVFVANALPLTSWCHIHRGKKVYRMLQAF